MRNILALLALTFACSAGAQPYLNNTGLNGRPQQKKANFYDVQHAFNEYWSDKTPSQIESENEEEGGYQQFKRWEWFMQQRTFPNGNFPSPEILYQEYRHYSVSHPQNNMNVATAGWAFMGPHVVPGNGGGAGRINCLTIDPTNNNTLWVGTACGGLWKSIDGGSTWTSNTDLLPSLSISDIVIDPTNTNIMYLATGDKYGIYWQYEVWGHYSAGVLKSTDGGVTWNPTGLNYAIANVTLIQRLILDPSNTNILYAATNQGIFKTTDAGATWNSIRNGKFYDIEMKPGASATLYAGDSIGVILSTNSGTTWNYVPTVTSNGRTSICVTPVNPTRVVVWSEGGGLYTSNNSATSFSTLTDPTATAGPYGYYDMVLEVSPTNENVMFAGGLDIALSTNGGGTWNVVSDWNGWPGPTYSHADNHCLRFGNSSSTSIYSCNDGGIFHSANQGSSWTDLSGGIDIKQYYRISGSALTPTLIYGGAQDNGTDQVSGVNTATRVYGADGEDCLVDYTDDNIVFVSSQGGAFQRSTDGGVTFNSMGAFGCDWTSPIIMDPTDHNIMYMGSSDVNRSTDNGVTWNNVSNGAFDGGCIYSLRLSANNPAYVYAATFGHIYRSTNSGGTWTNITGSLPVNLAAISGIAVSDVNPDAVWVTFSGFSGTDKVYYSNDGGATWSNITGTLPNVPANCIEYQNNSNDLVYLGTDLGVFYRDGTMNDWTSYNTGLPNVIIDDLEINYPTSKLRAGTFGRGIWESDLQVSTLVSLDASVFSMSYPPSVTCDTVIAPIIRIRNAGINTITSVDVYYRMDAQSWQTYNWSGTLASNQMANITLPVYNLSAGTHTLKAYSTNPNLSADMNNNNDTLTRTFTILSSSVVGAVAPPVFEGFVSSTFPPNNWQLTGSTALWSRSTAAGGFGTSMESAMADFYNIFSGTQYLATQYIDLSNAVAPIKMYFDVAYAPYNPTYLDSLFVDMYADCPGTATILYKKGYTSLATAAATTSIFVPLANEWRTDTLTLDSLAGHSDVRFRFIAKSGYGNQLYIDNINLSANGVGIVQLDLNSSFSVYPNPSNNTLNIDLNASQPEPVEFSIFDLTGKMVMARKERASSGMNHFNFDMTTLAEGIYMLEVNENGNIRTQRISVVR